MNIQYFCWPEQVRPKQVKPEQGKPKQVRPDLFRLERVEFGFKEFCPCGVGLKWCWPEQVAASLVDTPQDILVSLKIADSLMP